jgi:hypothetical protein
VVRVLAIRLKVAGSNPPESMYFKSEEIHSTTSFGWEVKPSVQCRKILRLVKELYEYERCIS